MARSTCRNRKQRNQFAIVACVCSWRGKSDVCVSYEVWGSILAAVSWPLVQSTLDINEYSRYTGYQKYRARKQHEGL